MRQIGRLENMTEKSGLQSMAGITKYKGFTSQVVEIYYHIVQLRVPPYIHRVAGKKIISLYDTKNTVYKHRMKQFLKISKAI